MRAGRWAGATSNTDATAGKLGDIAVIGFDNISAVQTLVKDGTVLATVDQHADQIAVNGIEYALAILDGRQVPEDLQTPVTLVTDPAQ